MATVLRSEQVVVEAPMSFAGSARRVWKITRNEPKALTVTFALILVSLVWCVVLAWYFTFGLLVVPYRLIRRSQRKGKRDSLRHRETLDAITRMNAGQAAQPAPTWPGPQQVAWPHEPHPQQVTGWQPEQLPPPAPPVAPLPAPLQQAEAG